jgi:hypothetical protein
MSCLRLVVIVLFVLVVVIFALGDLGLFSYLAKQEIGPHQQQAAAWVSSSEVQVAAQVRPDVAVTCGSKYSPDFPQPAISSTHFTHACKAPFLPPREAPKERSVAAIIQSFDHASVACNITRDLANQRILSHVLIYDDGSTDGSEDTYRECLKLHKLTPGSSSVFSSPNLHEVRNYNRGLRHIAKHAPASVEYIALMQDDDVLLDPTEPWMERGVALFEAFPSLCVLGGLSGWTTLNSEAQVGREDGDEGTSTEFTSFELTYIENNKKQLSVPYQCRGIPFMFAMGVNTAPVLLRRSCVDEVGLFREEEDFSREGKCLATV